MRCLSIIAQAPLTMPARGQGSNLPDLPLDEQEALWQAAKREERKGTLP